MNNKIIEEILEKQKEILTNRDSESISVYLFLKKEYEKGNIKNNGVFQFVFRSYYRLDNAGLGEKLKNKYFELLANKQNDLSKILSELYKILSLRKLNTIQFSFATKLLHTIDNNNPIFDAEVSRVIHKRVSGRTRDEKIKSCLEIYEFLKNEYGDFLQNEQIKKLILEFRERFNVSKDKMSDIKILDFIVWSLGKIQEKNYALHIFRRKR